jgi:hypothetical protein
MKQGNILFLVEMVYVVILTNPTSRVNAPSLAGKGLFAVMFAIFMVPHT